MSDLGDDFKAFKEAKKEYKTEVTKTRMTFVMKELDSMGVKAVQSGPDLIVINNNIEFWPFTGWFQGKGFQGRGFKNLIKRLEEL